MSKLTSRKFWICVASFLGSIGTSIAGFQTDNEVVAIVGIICATFSAAIYSACEAAVDKANATTSTMNMTTNYYGVDGVEETTETEVEE